MLYEGVHMIKGFIFTVQDKPGALLGPAGEIDRPQKKAVHQATSTDDAQLIG